jgi:hypothetical protein
VQETVGEGADTVRDAHRRWTLALLLRRHSVELATAVAGAARQQKVRRRKGGIVERIGILDGRRSTGPSPHLAADKVQSRGRRENLGYKIIRTMKICDIIITLMHYCLCPDLINAGPSSKIHAYTGHSPRRLNSTGEST